MSFNFNLVRKNLAVTLSSSWTLHNYLTILVSSFSKLSAFPLLIGQVSILYSTKLHTHKLPFAPKEKPPLLTKPLNPCTYSIQGLILIIKLKNVTMHLHGEGRKLESTLNYHVMKNAFYFTKEAHIVLRLLHFPFPLFSPLLTTAEFIEEAHRR